VLALRAWSRGLPLDAFAQREDSQFPLRLKAALPLVASQVARLATVRSEHPGTDGSVRLLLTLGDGQTIESVLLPGEGVCVSTQVGCAVGCTFCMTGRGGLLRQLRSAEIVAQVALARARRPVRRVVFMGMGEPAHNLDSVMEAIALLGTEGALNSKNLVLSTVGDRRVFERLPLESVKPALALSLHTTKPDLRAALLPRAPRIDPKELVELAERYARTTKYPTQYQWTLLEGVNDGDDELENLATLLAGKYAVMNFIPYNVVPGSSYRRPSSQRAAAMARYLHQRGILTKLRRSAGQDVEAGCGQLRARAVGQ
jgi:23S rRNA (adenine2503-C2)-methyltransferase